jgi:hypothetical protein
VLDFGTANFVHVNVPCVFTVYVYYRYIIIYIYIMGGINFISHEIKRVVFMALLY